MKAPQNPVPLIGRSAWPSITCDDPVVSDIRPGFNTFNPTMPCSPSMPPCATGVPSHEAQRVGGRPGQVAQVGAHRVDRLGQLGEHVAAAGHLVDLMREAALGAVVVHPDRGRAGVVGELAGQLHAPSQSGASSSHRAQPYSSGSFSFNQAILNGAHSALLGWVPPAL